jgi:diadenosine tetraphosphate (Ap4A) HIT family hydrolase
VASALGPLAAKVMRAQREALGAEHVYAFAIGDALRHFHLHLVPRYADTPERLYGRRCFEGTAADMVPEEEIVAAARRVSQALDRMAVPPSRRKVDRGKPGGEGSP